MVEMVERPDLRWIRFLFFCKKGILTCTEEGTELPEFFWLTQLQIVVTLRRSERNFKVFNP